MSTRSRRGAPRHASVSTAAPTRIDLAGGTLDIWPICLIEPAAATVNLAIDRRARATARLRDDGRFLLRARDLGVTESFDDVDALRAGPCSLALHREVALHVTGLRGGTARHRPSPPGLELTTRSGVPPGSGLGGSSALFVAALQATLEVTGRRLSRAVFLRTVIDLEARLIAVPTGSQDYIPAMHGGLSHITYPAGGTARHAIRTDLAAIARRLVLVYTGLPHDSAINNWQITQAYLDGDPDVRANMGAIAAASRALVAALDGTRKTGRAGTTGRSRVSVDDRLDAAGFAIAAEWAARKRLAPGVTTPDIERLGETARTAGAMAHKVCGAGGGGCVFFWCESGRRAAVTRALVAAGAEVLRFRPAEEGVRG